MELPQFNNCAWLIQALTHRSCVHESSTAGSHNERLEFLGDAILNFLSGEFLYQQFPDLPEGRLTALRSALVGQPQLAEFALLLGLGHRLRLSKGTEQQGGRQNPKLLCSAFEAVIGAYFLDQDSEIEPVRQYVVPFFRQAVEQLGVDATPTNYKSQFQEWAQARFAESPQYVTVAEQGADHAKQFTVEVYLAGRCYGRGQGRRKQDAEKQAAQNALKVIKVV
jgi:ribonuclease-3